MWNEPIETPLDRACTKVTRVTFVSFLFPFLFNNSRKITDLICTQTHFRR